MTPAPGVSTRAQRIHHAEVALFEGNIEHNFSAHVVDLIRNNIAFLVDHGRDTLDEVIASSRSSSLEAHVWSECLKARRFAPDPNDWREIRTPKSFFITRYRMLLVTYGLVRRIAELENWDDSTTHVAMISYEDLIEETLPKQKARTATPDDAIEATALIGYIQGWFITSGYQPKTTHQRAKARDVEYIVSRLDEVWSILPELVARKDHSRKVIEMLLDSPSPALAIGAL